jgi:zinc protease
VVQKLLVTSIESQLSIPAAQAESTVAQHFNSYPKGDVRYAPSLQERLEDVRAVSLDDVKRYCWPPPASTSTRQKSL